MRGYERTWAPELRYDGDRQRYLSRELDPVTLYPSVFDGTWTDYAGDTPMVDYDPSTTPPANTFSYVPGVAEIDLSSPPAETAHYLHTDHLGSTWFKTDAPALGNPVPTRQVIRSAFGEVVFIHPGPESRYGYAGVWGYQQHDYDNGGQGDGKPDTVVNTSATDGFPFLHVGARYYDPSTGRFLQRDPIGLRGGMSVYAYVQNTPTIRVDPSGLMPQGALHEWTLYKADRDRGLTAEEAAEAARRRAAAEAPVAGLILGAAYPVPTSAAVLCYGIWRYYGGTTGDAILDDLGDRFSIGVAAGGVAGGIGGKLIPVPH